MSFKVIDVPMFGTGDYFYIPEVVPEAPTGTSDSDCVLVDEDSIYCYDGKYSYTGEIRYIINLPNSPAKPILTLQRNPRIKSSLRLLNTRQMKERNLDSFTKTKMIEKKERKGQ